MENDGKRLKATRAGFVEAVRDLRQWAEDSATDRGFAGWETTYEQWPRLTRAYSDVLDAARPDELDEELMDLLLYALARDNEDEVLKEELVSRPDQLIALARRALLSPEADAKWQIADALGSVVAAEEDVAPLIEQFLQDPAEYVSRRALIALARRGSDATGAWAVRAWDTNHEYQRMAALDVLAVSHSPLLGSYLDLAEADGRQHLASLASEIRSRPAPVQQVR